MLKRMLIGMLMLMLAQSSLQAGTVPTQENVTKLYVATFNRAPDAAGLNYWVNDSGLTLEQISQSFFDQPETQSMYPPSLDNESFVQQIYLNLFNREPDQAGLQYWSDELDLYDESNGTLGIPRDKMILAVVNGAQGDDAIILQNKADTGLYFADAGLQYVDFYLQDSFQIEVHISRFQFHFQEELVR